MKDDLTRTAAMYRTSKMAAESAYAVLVPAILEARRAGMTLRAIAEATGLSFARIHQIVRRNR